MKPRLCIVGYKPVIALARKAAAEVKSEADFIFVTSLLEEALPLLKEVEGAADIVLAGPSTRRMHSGELSIPVIAFRPTFPDLIRAVQEARQIDRRIGLCLSREDVEFDIPFEHIKSIEKLSDRTGRVVLWDGRELKLRDSNDVNDENNGIFVVTGTGGKDKVEIDWTDFDRVEFQTK